jgi:pyridoxal 5'-phosphate synthase pdxT subunit
MKIGVLALQGAFIEHVAVIEKLGAEAIEVRLPRQLEGLSGLIIPGGESTTILKLMHIYEIFEPLRKRIVSGFPAMGTCAGMICLAGKVSNSEQSILQPLAVMDIHVKRNAFGRQVDSFEADLKIPALGNKPYHAVFIRAPLIEKIGPGVKILAQLPNDVIVSARQDNLLVCSFHPELTSDLRFHKYFLEIAVAQREHTGVIVDN